MVNVVMVNVVMVAVLSLPCFCTWLACGLNLEHPAVIITVVFDLESMYNRSAVFSVSAIKR